MSQSFEIHVVFDREGVKSTQIIGPAETHPEGHDFFFKIRDLIQDFNKAVETRIKSEKENKQ